MLSCQEFQCLGILGEAASAIADTGIQETRTDPFIITHAFCHILDICANQFTEISDIIHVGDLKCQKIIAGILDHLC